MNFAAECLKALGQGQNTTLGASLQAFETAARAARPTVELDVVSFARFVSERAASQPVETLHAGDVLLAWACLHGQREALTLFETEVMPMVARAIRRVDPTEAVVDELSALTRTRLLVSDAGRPAALSGYGGTGPVSSYAMVVATRLAVDQKRAPTTTRSLKDVLLGGVSDGSLGADVRLSKAQLRGAVQRALVAATAALTPRERTLLKLHLVQGVSAEKLGRMYKVHRATTTRWLTDARHTVLQVMTSELKRELKVGSETLAVLRGDLLDGLDLTLSGVLSSAEPPPSTEP